MKRSDYILGKSMASQRRDSYSRTTIYKGVMIFWGDAKDDRILGFVDEYYEDRYGLLGIHESQGSLIIWSSNNYFNRGAEFVVGGDYWHVMEVRHHPPRADEELDE